MGTFEGAIVAAAISAQHDEITHLIMLDSGSGMKQADELRTLSGSQNIDFDQAYKRFLNSPDSVDKTFLGQTYK